MKHKKKTTSSTVKLECCICFRTNNDKILWNTQTNSPAMLNDWNLKDGILDNDILFMGPCNIHSYCVQCVKYIAIGFDNHPVGPLNSNIPCRPPFEGGECFSLSGLSNYFTHNDMKKILTPEEFIQYSNHIERYQFPGFELVKCPRPIYKNHTLTKCEAGILVPLEDIMTKQPGHLIILCDQNEKCTRRSCYHCQNLISRYTNSCHYCVTMDEANNPKSLNRYFYVVGKQLKDGQETCYKNEDITTEIALNQIIELAESDKIYVRCLECLVPICKTEQCNTLTHCKIERCYCCGRSGTRLQNDLGDHWDTTGLKGCPRFDYSKYWNTAANCNFKCEENKCYNEELGECKQIPHQEGIKNMHEERKKGHIFHALQSLLPNIKHQVLCEMWIQPKLKKYIPNFVSTDHRTYVPDTLQRQFIRNKEYSQLFKPFEFEKPIVKVKSPTSSSSSSYRTLFADLYQRYIK
jgi:hypothetical protein